MDDFALVPAGNGPAAVLQLNGEISTLAEQYIEPIAEHNFARKKMLALEQGIEKLRKEARQLHEIVTQQGGDMKIMVSEEDLRRAIGLAFQEFELRLEDSFTDSNRKCLAMFSKREEMLELQGLIGKKVNWSEYNTVLKKLSDLRQYIDTMAESVFIGHRDALNSEFAKKADAVVVDEALKAKADFSEVSEVRARLERLEVLVGHTAKDHSTSLEEMRNSLSEKAAQLAEKQWAAIAENQANIVALRGENGAVLTRLTSAEGAVNELQATVDTLVEKENKLEASEAKIFSNIASLHEQLGKADADALQLRQDFQNLATGATEFQESSSKKFQELTAQGSKFEERLDFLMQATEMIKRKSRETNKSNTTKFGEISEEQDKHTNQIAALERQLKKQERDVRAIENRANRAEGNGGSLAALKNALPGPTLALTGGPAPELAGADQAGSERLKGVLEQLEKIAMGGHPFEQMGIEMDPSRPPLPWGGEDKRGIDYTALPRFAGAAGPAPIDSARGPSYPSPQTGAIRETAASARYGLSPRPAGTGAGSDGGAPSRFAGSLSQGGAARTPRRKK